MKVGHVVSGASLGFALLGAICCDAQAMTMPGCGGHAYVAAEQSCFYQYGWNSIGQQCNGAPKAWVIPVSNRAGGTVTFVANSTHASGSGRPVCTGWVIDQFAAVIFQSSTMTVGTETVLGSTSAAIQSDTYHFICNLTSDDYGGKGLATVRTFL